MKLEEFYCETWMTDHENDCLYNMADTCVKPLSFQEFQTLINKDLTSSIMNMTMDYGPIVGSYRLKKAILKQYATGNEQNLSITHGAINANELVIMELLEPQDHVICLTPTYQQLYSLPESMGCTVDKIELHEDNRWLPRIEDFERVISDQTKMILLNCPNNPTGTVIPHDLMLQIIALAKRHHTYILCDEVYRGIDESPVCESLSDLYDLGIATSSLSKVYSFAGLRLGWIKGPEEVIKKIDYRRDYHIISSGPLNDYLGTLVLENKDVLLKRSRSICAQNKSLLKEWLEHEPHITCEIPKDGTVCFLKYDFNIASVDLCEKLQKETGVFFLPGSCFEKEYHLRFGFTGDSKVIQKGLELFSKWIKENHL